MKTGGIWPKTDQFRFALVGFFQASTESGVLEKVQRWLNHKYEPNLLNKEKARPERRPLEERFNCPTACLGSD
jgi:hypothetical protein